MSLIRFTELPDTARLWIFGSARAPDPDETAHLVAGASEFLEEWAAHGASLRAGLDWRHRRFLLVAADESAAEASGCSIDALVGRISELEAELDLGLTDSAPVWYRDPGGGIRRVSRAEFRSLAGAGRVGPETPVFDLTLERVGELRSRGLERPAGESWHAALLPDGSGSPHSSSSSPSPTR